MDLLQKVARRLATGIFAATLAALCLAPQSTHAVGVTGFGLFGNAELRNALALLEIPDGPVPAQSIDDGAFLILTRLTQNGFLDAKLTATYRDANDNEQTLDWPSPFEPITPEGTTATKLKYHVETGPLYHYETFSISGLNTIDPDEARNYFIPDATLVVRKRDKAYSPSILSNQKKQLAAALAQEGYLDARIDTTQLETNSKTGAVAIALRVNEGPLYRILAATINRSANGEALPAETLTIDRAYSRTWIENQIRELRNESYHLGFPDTKVTSRVASSTAQDDGSIGVEISFQVNRGSYRDLAAVEHRGAPQTQTSLLNRKADLATGTPLDITQTEAARRRLSRLGIFRQVNLTYEERGPDARAAIFEYTPGTRIETKLLVGYGSFEGPRAGFLASRRNLLGRAHSLDFSAIQSVRSTTGKLRYSLPEILGEAIDGNFELNYLDREELFFDRTERGVSLGLSTRLTQLRTDVALDYAFDKKKSSDPQFGEERGLEETDIGSLALRLSRNTLDSLLYPTNGYELTSALRYADQSLGGQTEFIRYDFGAAAHRRLGQRLITHASLRGGIIKSPDPVTNPIPEVERFSVGGENSVRGYRRGEAGTLGSNGVPEDAQAFTLLNLELEYPLLDKLNLVAFFDTAQIWADSERLSSSENRSSIGLGFRYNTIIGPVRLEYGHNLSPRPTDPQGTLHLSVGFPF